MSRLRAIAVFACAFAVGGYFVVAGVLKSVDVEGFARDIALHRILGAGLSAVLARVLVPFEIVAGISAILGYRRRLAMALLAASLVVFIAATGWAWAHGNTEGCGCLGRFAARTPLEVIVEDALMLAACALAIVLMPRSPAPARRWRAATVGLVGVLAAAFTLASPLLPIDNYATALRPGATISGLGLDAIAGSLDQGDRVLAVLVLDEEPSREAVASLNALAASPGFPPITGLTSAPEDERAEFFWNYGPSFEILEVPSADLKRLYRRAPRVFQVHNGAVLRVWESIPPAEELIR